MTNPDYGESLPQQIPVSSTKTTDEQQNQSNNLTVRFRTICKRKLNVPLNMQHAIASPGPVIHEYHCTQMKIKSIVTKSTFSRQKYHPGTVAVPYLGPNAQPFLQLPVLLFNMKDLTL